MTLTLDWSAQAGALRAGIFAGVLVLLLAAEARWPRRAGAMRRGLRWGANLPLVVLDALATRLLVPLGAVGVAAWAQARGIGLLPALHAAPLAAGAIAFVALDGVIYWQHRLFHGVPVLWRLHRVHHSDVEFDATTALRFHPGEIVLSMGVKMLAVAALGAPVAAVIAFEVALNASAMFNHANVRLPPALDAALRRVVVTPDMHRVHHSVLRAEHDRNYGFNLAWWDRLFGTYTAQPRDAHAVMPIGLDHHRADPEQRLWALLRQPLDPQDR
ncbi:MAG TPA: sterol desaturase family protein [Candidatus Binatia bacterium]|nr:sterol desaturase family protein [Candidatus Binatia bacterium]